MKILDSLSLVAAEIQRRGMAFADDVEVRITREDSYGYELQNRDLAPKISLGRVRVGIRALKGGQLAMAATTTLDVDTCVEALKAALAAARPTPLTGFASGAHAPSVAGHDPGWEAWVREPGRLHQLALTLRDRTFNECGPTGRLESAEGGLSFSTEWLALATREGAAAFKQTLGGAFVQINSGHYQVLHFDAPPEGEALEATGRLGVSVFEEIPARSVSPSELGVKGEVAAILAPRQLEAMLRVAAGEKFTGSSALSGLSKFESGQPLWDKAITLVDSGVEPGLASSRPVDDELIPTGETPLIEAGAFAGRVWGRRSGAEGQQAPTGNGYRDPILIEDPHEAPVRDSLSGLVMAPGARPKAELFAGVDKGIYLFACLGLHGADKARASFSTTVYDGFAIEGGEITATLAPGRWNVASHLFPEGDRPGLLGQVRLSAERENTGRALLPWVQTRLSL